MTAISLRVSVPVLSVQMKVVEPSVSTASRRRTRACRSAIRCARRAPATGSRWAAAPPAPAPPSPRSRAGSPRWPCRAQGHRDRRRRPPPRRPREPATTRTTRSSCWASGLRGRTALWVSAAMPARRVPLPVATTDGIPLALDHVGARVQRVAGGRVAAARSHRSASTRRRRPACPSTQLQVGRDPVAGLEHDHVAHAPGQRRRRRWRRPSRRTVTRRGQQVAQPCGGPFGAVLLREREHAVEHARRCRWRRPAWASPPTTASAAANHSMQREEVHHLAGQLAQRVRPRRRREPVRAVGYQPGRGDRAAQPAGRRRGVRPGPSGRACPAVRGLRRDPLRHDPHDTHGPPRGQRREVTAGRASGHAAAAVGARRLVPALGWHHLRPHPEQPHRPVVAQRPVEAERGVGDHRGVPRRLGQLA